MKRQASTLRLIATVVLAALPGAAFAQDGVPRGDSGAVKKDDAPSDNPSDKRQPPRVLNFVQPDYPPEAKAKGLEAQVTVQLDIDAAGKVTGVTVVNPAGNGFDES